MRILAVFTLVMVLICETLAEEERNNLNILCLENQTLTSVDDLIKGRRYLKAVEILEQILSSEKGVLIEKEKGLYVAPSLIIREKFRDYPDEVMNAVKLIHQRAVEEEMKKGLTVEQILFLLERYPFSGYEVHLLLMAGDIFFEKGEVLNAMRLYQRAECFASPEEKNGVLLRIACAASFTGDRKKALDYSSRLPLNISCGYGLISRDEFRRRLVRFEHLEQISQTVYSPCQNGRNSAIRFPLERKYYFSFSEFGGSESDRRRIARASPFPSVTVPFFPAYDNNRLYVPIREGVIELNLEDGSRRFLRCPTAREVNDVDTLYSVTLTESEIFISVPIRLFEGEAFQGIPVRASTPQRTVAVFDRKSAKFKYFLNDFAGFKERFEKKRWSLPSPPVVRENRAYCELKTLDTACTSYIVVFDLKEKSLAKVVPLCSNGVELTMFGYEAREPLSSPPASDGENFYLVTNLGTVCAFSLKTERLIWMREYSQMRLKAADNYFPEYRVIHWTVRPPLVKDGVLLFTPLDSQYAYAVDACTGALLWQLGYSNSGMGLNNLVGVCGDEVIFSGQKLGVVGLKSGKLRAVVGLPSSAGVGLGVVAGEEALIPTAGFVAIFDVKNEAVRADLQYMSGGNILASGEWVFVVDSNAVSVYHQGAKVNMEK